ncbi:ATP-dependent DNA helicase PIF1-like [Ptychodera flava]|uniref:ATP-dependent DNA helicase PIF1-like n=1 Tax=Ptychodera flava TaxID=63121 RepID=UPI00396A3704
MSRNEAILFLRSLNVRQQEIFYTVRQWCVKKVNGNSVEAFHMFLTGGAGTGKSHLIKAVCYEAARILAHILPNPDSVSVLLTEPTGVAAFNIDATTIHSTFSIPINAKLPYQPLGEEKINTLRCKLGTLQILIIDEISMVDKRLLSYVHGRLRQIKHTGNQLPFGGVSVIGVGDFYQLPPVKGQALYVNNEGVDLWNDYFSIAELTDIVRQQDSKFAETLNMIRTRKRSEDLHPTVVQMLHTRETGEEGNGIHIFATNKKVDECNIAKLHSVCSNIRCIEAQDYSRDPKPKKLIKVRGQHRKVYNTNLAKTLTLAVGARVMLTKNIDVSDGLVNGVFGFVSDISVKPNESFPSTVYVLFDNIKVGAKLRSHIEILSSIPENSTPIKF